MRIAIVSTPFVPVPPVRYGGTELIVWELAEGLAERGHRVAVFATGDSRTHADLRFLYDRARWPPDPLIELNHVAWAFREIAATGPWDVVHTHTPMGLPFGRGIDAPLVCTLHNERTEPLSDLYRCHDDSQYVAISRDQRRRSIPLPRIQVIHHGLAPDPYLGPSEGSDQVCFIGRFSPVKGPHTAIDVAEEAGCPIVVAGEIHPPDREFADRELRPRFEHPHVRHAGPVGLEEKSALLRASRALLVPIEWNEPFGLILIEAMLAGCPVVAFPRGSVPELVEPGVTGFIASSASHMVEIIRRGGLLDGFDRMACRARALERYGRERMVGEHERLYGRLMAAHATEPAPSVRAEPGRRSRSKRTGT